MTTKTTHYQSFTPQSTNTGGYRYFFNGQEGDNEVFGETANFGYEFRQYDSRLGRWWSEDPKWSEYPGVSPFVFCNGSPEMLMDPNGEEASETSSLLTGTEMDFKQDLKLEFKPFISLTEPPKGGKMQELKEKISNGFHRLDLMVASPYKPDPLEGHGDAWDRKLAKGMEPVAQGLALFHPGIGTSSNLLTIIFDKDIYGNEVSQTDKLVSFVGLFTGQSAKAVPGTTKTVMKSANYVSTAYSSFRTTISGIKKNYEKEKD